MRTVNYTLLSLMILAAGIIGGAAYQLHGYQLKRNAGALLREANAAKERGDRNQAIQLLERYVALVRNGDAASLAELGLMQADARRMKDAFRTLERALRQDSSRNDIRRRLIDVALEIGRAHDARYHIELLLKEAPDDHELISRLAQCQAEMGEFPEAATSLARAVELAPHNEEYAGKLAGLYHGELKDPHQALAVLDQLVNRNPDSSLAYVIRGGYQLDHRAEIVRNAANIERSTTANESTQESPEEPAAVRPAVLETEIGLLNKALADARDAMKLDPDGEAVLVFAVRCLPLLGQQAEAVELAERGRQLYPKNAFFYAMLAGFEATSGNVQGALQWYQRGLDEIPDDSDLLWNQSRQFVEEGQIADAEKNLAKLRRLNYPHPPISHLEAQLLMKQGEWLAASKQLEGIRASLREWPNLSKEADFLLGRCYQQLGRADLQLIALRRVVSVDPTFVPARLGIASVLLSSGNIDDAIEEYEGIATLPNAPASILAQLARLLVLANLRSNSSMRDWDRPAKILDRLSKIDPKSTSVPILRAEILLAKGADQTAEKVLTTARDQSPETLDYWLALMAFAERKDDPDKVQALLAEAEKSLGDSVPLRLAHARHLVYRRKAEAKAQVRELSENISGFTKDEQVELYFGLAGLAFAIGDFEETERLCTWVADEQPANLQVRTLLFDLAFRARRTDSMERALAQVQKIEGSGPLWHYGEAIRLCVSAETDQRPNLYSKAKEHLAEARVARPSWSRVPMLLAHIQQAQGEDAAAISSYIQAIKFGERDPETVSRAVALLYQRRRFQEADQLVRTLQEQQSPFSNELLQLATEISLRLNNRERALALVVNNVTRSDQPQDHIWAGRVLSALGKTHEAEQQFREAIDLADTSADAWVALIQHYGRTMQTQKAESALEQAERKVTFSDAPLALGQALESIGRLEEAAAKYQAALAARPRDVLLIRRLTEFYMRQQKFQEAEPLLRQVLEGQADVSDEDRIWSRRNLASLLAGRGKPAALKDAVKLIDSNLSAQPNSDADLRVKAIVLAQMPDRSSKIKAAEILEKILESRLDEATDEGLTEPRFVLAQLYVSLGDAPQAIRHFQKVMASQGDDPRYLKFYIQFLINRKEISEAELWLAKLQKVAPQEFYTLALTTEIQFLQRHYDNLLTSIDEFLSSSSLKPAEQQERLRQAANLLEGYAARLKQSEESEDDTVKTWIARFVKHVEDLLQRQFEERPQDVLALASFYGRSGRSTDALDLLEKNLATARPDEITAVTSTLMLSADVTPEQFARARQLLETALEQHGRPVALLFALANLQNWTEKYAEAEQLYREALKRSDQHAGALNNLAILLALRGRGGKEPLMLIEKALAVAGPVPALFDSRATVYLAQGDLVHAADDLEAAISSRPVATSYFRQSLVLMRLGKKDSAQESFSKALALRIRLEELHPLERPMFRQLQNDLH